MSIAKLPNRRDLISFVKSSLLTRLTMLGCRLARNVMLAHALGPANRGALSFAFTTMELILISCSMGLNTAIGYYAAQSQEAQRRDLSHKILMISIIFGSLMVAITLGLYFWPDILSGGKQVLEPYVLLIAAIIPLALYKILGLTFLNGIGAINFFNTLRLLDSLIPLLLFVILWQVVSWPAFQAGLISWLLAIILVTIAVAVTIKIQRFTLSPSVSVISSKDLLSYGRRSYFDSVFRILLLRSDHFLIGIMLGAMPLGLYAMATTAVELLLVISEAVTVPLFGYLQSRLKQADEFRVVGMALRISTAIIIVCAAILALLGELLITLLFGADFLPAHTALLILIPGVICLNFCAVARLVVLGLNQPISVSQISGAAFSINLVLNLLLIPLWGIEGAALSSTIAYSIAAIMYFIKLRQITLLNASMMFILRMNDLRILKLW